MMDCLNFLIILIYSGGQEGINKIQHMIDQDPKKHMYEIDSPYHILNRWNTHR